MDQNEALLNVSNDATLGKVEIAPEVIEIITGIAASEVEGISSMRGNFATGVAERFGKKTHSKGVKVELTDNGVMIDLYVTIKFGIPIRQTAETLQKNVKQALKNMTALETKVINVHVLAIEVETEQMNDPETT
ncbi:MAG TPA: Asp23/Gls24 family envelope stress response protein [Bacillota bacterium]|nr:Asp23/Gls24 family envelope stress response protein [Bacillota bacterium]